MSLGGMSSSYGYPSRRESMGSRLDENLTTEWFDSSELAAAVSPSTLSYSGQLLVETGTASQMLMEIDEEKGTKLDSTERKLKEIQKTYTIESWRFRT